MLLIDTALCCLIFVNLNIICSHYTPITYDSAMNPAWFRQATWLFVPGLAATIIATFVYREFDPFGVYILCFFASLVGAVIDLWPES